ncbi:MAG: RsbRD N-terminal domain-containing protein [Acidobacteria bacterium]|nr:RsbRD N-terminal domain-containing protein [Acidobacteriota bacterium]
MTQEISRLLDSGSEQIVRTWSEKVMSDRRVQSNAQLSYMQLIDHIPQIIEELKHAIAKNAPEEALKAANHHGRQRWQQGYELKEVIRELILLRATLLEFLETYRGAMRQHNLEQLTRAYRQINGFIDEELYKTVEAYLEAPQPATPVESAVV